MRDGNTKRREGIAGSKAWMIKGLMFDGASELNARRTSRRLAINHNHVIDTLGTVDGRKVHARMHRGLAPFWLRRNSVLDISDESLFTWKIRQS